MPVLRRNPEPARIPAIVFALLGLAGVAALLFFGLMLVARSEFTQPEGIVATQVRHFSQAGALYFDLRQYPYTVCAYMPVFYGLAAGLIQAGLPAILAGRLISWLALLALLWLLGRIVAQHGLGTAYQLLAIALGGLTQLLLSWGTTGQVDMLAVAFSLAAYYSYLRRKIYSAVLFTIAALLTKQTAIVAPTVIFLALARENWRLAFRFGVLAAGGAGFVVLGLNWWLDGRFLANTLFANLNPFALSKLRLPLEYFGLVLSAMLVVVLSGAAAAWQKGWSLTYGYFTLALAWFLFSSAKVGADSNYLIESAALLIICGVLSLGALQYFELEGGRSWVTLLVLPLCLYVVQNGRVAVSALGQRFEREARFAAQVEQVKPLLDGKRRLLSADSNLLLHAGRSLEVEPLIYRLLVEAGRIDPQPVLRDIEAGVFDAIVLYDDVTAQPDPDPEIPRLPSAQMAAVSRHYELIQHAPGPNLAGLYVYQPKALAQRQ